MARKSIGNLWGQALGPSNILRRYHHQVFVRPTWEDPWLYVPYLEAISAAEASLPGSSSATFRLRYGDMKREDRFTYERWLAFEQWVQYGGIGGYVCIRVLPGTGASYPLWCGVLPAHAMRVLATRLVHAPPQSYPAGDEMFTAQGFEYLLQRRRVNGAWIDADGVAEQIRWSPPFNERLSRGAGALGNRSGEELTLPGTTRQTYVFGAETDVDASGDPYRWSVRDIIEYLFNVTNPIGELDGWEPHFYLRGFGTVLAYLDTIHEVIRQDGQTVWSLLRTLLDRRRGIGGRFAFHLDTNATVENPDDPDGEEIPNVNYGLPNGPIELRVYSMTDIVSQVGEFTMPTNNSHERIILDDAGDIELAQALIETDHINVYDKIVVQGARTISCFTASCFEDPSYAELEAAWSSADETTYKAANDTERSDDRLDRVYRLFRLPADYDWQTRGETALNPSFNEDAVIDLANNAPYWRRAPELLDWLPIMAIADTVSEEATPRLLKPLVLVNVLDDQGAPTERWILADDPPVDDEDLMILMGEPPKADVTIQDRGATIEVKYSPAHVLAHGHFDPEVDNLASHDTKQLPLFNYAEGMLVTLAARTDTRPQVIIYTASPGGIVTRTLIIEIPEVQFWVIAPTTIIGVNPDGTLKHYAEDRITRDDTHLLRRIAALAKAVYSRERRAIKVVRRGLLDIHELGNMITEVIVEQQTQEVNAVVTSRRWDFAEGTTTIETDFLNLDVRRVR